MKNSKKTSQTNVTAIAVMENRAAAFDAFDAAMAERGLGSPVVILTPRTGKNGTKLPNRLMYDKLAEAVARDQKVVIDFSIGTCDFEFKTATTGVERAKSFARSVKSALLARGVDAYVRRMDAVVILKTYFTNPKGCKPVVVKEIYKDPILGWQPFVIEWIPDPESEIK